MSGVPEKNTVSITSLVEGLACLVGFILYQIAHSGMNVMMTVALVSGAILSTPAATRTVRVLPDKFFDGRWPMQHLSSVHSSLSS